MMSLMTDYPQEFPRPLHPSMAHYDTFREQLAIKYPAIGHALWGPSPRNGHDRVEVGASVSCVRANSTNFSMPFFPQATDPTRDWVCQSTMRFSSPACPIISTQVFSVATTTVQPESPWRLSQTFVLRSNSYYNNPKLSLTFAQPRWLSRGLVYLHQEARRRSVIHSSTGSTSGHPRAWRFWKVDAKTYRPLVCFHPATRARNRADGRNSPRYWV